jgi:hypothetical protein
VITSRDKVEVLRDKINDLGILATIESDQFYAAEFVNVVGLTCFVRRD